MDLLVDTDLTLATLPADVIRTIIQMEVPESIDNLRLVRIIRTMHFETSFFKKKSLFGFSIMELSRFGITQ